MQTIGLCMPLGKALISALRPRFRVVFVLVALIFGLRVEAFFWTDPEEFQIVRTGKDVYSYSCTRAVTPTASTTSLCHNFTPVGYLGSLRAVVISRRRLSKTLMTARPL